MRLMIMYKIICGFIFFSLFSNAVNAATLTKTAQSDIAIVLDSFHQAASEANFEQYMGLLAQGAIFLGTDSSERWNKSEFSEFVKSYFSQGKGWLYRPVERNITGTQANHIVFFDELLENENYGLCRGTGVLINTPKGWKILQYNLSIVVPNAVAKEVVESIKEHRSITH